jgi:putative DNA primase/helicase
VKILEAKALAEAAEKRAQQMLRKPMGGGTSLIQKFNETHSVTDILVAAGYVRKGKKWLAPNSQSGIPGLVVFEDGRVYSHHSNDALNGGHSHDAFGIFCLIWHDGNPSAACAALRRGT